MINIKKISNFLSSHSKKILWLMIIIYFLSFSLICLWKYYNFGYNGLDLAIINQAFYNSSQGNLFASSIHEPSYLGDHLALGMNLLLPFYAIFPQPLTLLIIQSLILALCAWPLYLIAKKMLPANWPLFIALAWLLNPFVQNINIFEYHNLPLAVLFLLWTFYFYLEKNFPAFVAFSVLSLLVREDIPLVIFMFAVLAIINRRQLKWIIWPAVSAVSWFIIATAIISSITPSGSYKYLYYYNWLGSDWREISLNIFTHPWLVLSRLLSLNNIIFILALLLPFAFIFLQPELLLLGLLIFFQLVMGGSNNSIIVLKTHYATLLLPALFIAFIFSLSKLFKLPLIKLSKIKKYIIKEKFLLIGGLIVTTLYASLSLGPLPAVIKQLIKPVYSSEVKEIKTAFYQSVPADVAVATSYEFLTNLSSRPQVYSLHYAYIGKKQFSEIPYQLPTTTQTLLVDFDDLVTYAVQFPNSSQWQEYYLNGDNNFRNLIFGENYQLTKIIDSLAIFNKNFDPQPPLYQIAYNFSDIDFLKNIDYKNGLIFLGWSKNSLTDLNKIDNLSPALLPISLYFKTEGKIAKDYQLKLLIKNKDGQVVHQKYYAMSYGLYPTSEWQKGETIKINYWFLIPKEIVNIDYQVELQIVYLEGFLTLNGIRTAVADITQEAVLEPVILLTK